MKKCIKGLNALFLIILSFVFLFSSYPVPAFAAEEEPLLVDGKKVTYLNSSTQVTIPKFYQTPIAEMRGVWVATVFNIDIGKQAGTTESAIKAYQDNFVAILDRMELYRMNTIFFQIRPANDAFYPSELNPWSEFLAGHGVNPGWDPLEWMIEETHKRGMFFQCWLNAFRITPSAILPNETNASRYSNEELISLKHQKLNSLSEISFARRHPEYVILGESDTKLILNPGEPAVQDFLVDTITEIVSKYDVDGLHFDDYFYLSGSGANSQTTNRNFAGGNTVWHNEDTLNDLGTYNRYVNNPSSFQMPAGLSLGDFRRESINNMMRKIRQAIDSHNQKTGKFVEFGSKPAAVWRSNIEYCPGNERTSPDGSNTHCYAYSSYYDLFADTKKWVAEGLVDYIAPQVYYDFANREVPYADIVSWWADVVSKTNDAREAQGLKPVKMYVAHGIYQFEDSDTRFLDPKEMVYQLKFNQKFPCIKGSAVFAYNDLLANTTTLLKQGMAYFRTVWNQPVLPLPRGEDDSGNLAIDHLNIVRKQAESEFKIFIPYRENIAYYVLYQTDSGGKIDLNSSQNRSDIISARKEGNILNLTKEENKRYFLRPVSKNCHPSSNIKEIDFGQAQPNTPPELGEIIFNEGKPIITPLTDTLIKFKQAVDAEDRIIDYQILVSITGPEGNFRYEVEDYEIVGEYIYAYWYSFAFDIEEVCVKVIASDGDLETYRISNVAKLVSSCQNQDPEPEPNPGPKGCQTGTCWLTYAWLFSFGLLFLLKKRR